MCIINYMDKKTYEEKKARAERLSEDGGDLQHAVNCASEILGNPILIFDTSYKLLAHAGAEKTDDRLIAELVSTGIFSHETVNFFNTEKFILTYAKSEVVSRMESNQLKYARFNGKLFNRDNVQVANFLTVESRKPFEEGDMELCEILCGVVSAKLQNDSRLYDKISKVYQENLLFDYIQNGGDSLSSAALASLTELSKMKADKFLAIADIAQYDPTLTHLAYFKDVFSRIQPEYLYYVDLSNIVILISLNGQVLKPKKHLARLNKFFAENNIYAGVSGKFNDLSEMRRCYGEAVNALNYGLMSKRIDDNFFYYDDFKAEHFFNAVKETADISDIHSPVISAIQSYDDKNKTALLETLYEYLLYVKEKSLTAKVLGIDLRELNRRIKLLENKFGINFKNGNALMNLFISLKIFLNT